jgi:hypothetical protein
MAHSLAESGFLGVSTTANEIPHRATDKMMNGMTKDIFLILIFKSAII